MTSGLSCSPLHVQDGKTALYIASWNGHDHIVELLLRREANVNHQTKVRPLMLVLCVIYALCCAKPYKIKGSFCAINPIPCTHVQYLPRFNIQLFSFRK